jgi:aryl-alcohol dehydrogenase-like predicted oxidoreductase
MIPFERVGKSGLKLSQLTYGSALTIGTESSNVQYAHSMIDKAWDLGIRSFDTSNNYGFGAAEQLLGQALKKYPREQFVLATKGSWPLSSDPYHKGLSRKHIHWAFEQSLNRLGMDYVDIYYAHRFDPETSIEEIVRVFNDLIRSGRILYWATSEWPLSSLVECHNICEKLGMEKPILEQCIYSYAINKADINGVYDFCKSNGVGLLGFSPLAQGLLTGKYRNSIPQDSRIAKSNKIGYDKTSTIFEQHRDRIEFFIETSNKFGIQSTHAAIQWVLRRGVLPVIGASRVDQIIDNINALAQEIPDEFWFHVDKCIDL